MKLLGSVLLALALVKGALLSMHMMDTIDLEFGPYEVVATVIDLVITLVLSVWCLYGKLIAWKYSMWYLVAIAVYSVIYEVMTIKVWDDVSVLGLVLLVLLYGCIVFAFSRKAFLNRIGADSAPRTLELFAFISMSVGALLVVGPFFNWIVAVVVVVLIFIAMRSTKALSEQ